MKKDFKYNKLFEFFDNENKEEVCLSFDQIENILGFTLDRSEITKKSWWYNNKRKKQSWVWLDANFKTIQIGRNIKQEKIVFHKEKNNKKKIFYDPLFITIIGGMIVLILWALIQFIYTCVNEQINAGIEYDNFNETLQSYIDSDSYDTIIKFCDKNLSEELLNKNPRTYMLLLLNKTDSMVNNLEKIDYSQQKDYLYEAIGYCINGINISNKNSDIYELDFTCLLGNLYNILTNYEGSDDKINNAIECWVSLSNKINEYYTKGLISKEEKNIMLINMYFGYTNSYEILAEYCEENKNIKLAYENVQKADEIIIDSEKNGQELPDETYYQYSVLCCDLVYLTINIESSSNDIDNCIQIYEDLVSTFDDGSFKINPYIFSHLGKLYLIKKQFSNDNELLKKAEQCLLKSVLYEQNLVSSKFQEINKNILMGGQANDKKLLIETIDQIDKYLNEFVVIKDPIDYAWLQYCKGDCYFLLYFLDNKKSEYSDNAIVAYDNALIFFKKDQYFKLYQAVNNQREFLLQYKKTD